MDDPVVQRAAAASLAALDFQLGRAVRQRLHSLSAPALLLGGGLLSAALAVHAQAAGVPLRTFSLALPGSDEAAAAQAVARHLGLVCTELAVTPAELQSGFKATLHTLPGPHVDAAGFVLAHAARRLRDDGLQVLGGDELATLDGELQRCIAALPAAMPLRAALRQLLADRLPASTLQRVHARPAVPPAWLLQDLQPRLFKALGRLRASPAAAAPGLPDLPVLGEQLRAWYAGEPVSAARTWSLALQLLWQAEVLPARLSAPPRQRLVVYTALVGAKEALADPLADLPPGAGTDLELDFVCITDNPSLRSDTWRMLMLPRGERGGQHLPAEKLSRRPKALPHEYFPDDRYSLYIDNTVGFKRLPQASDLATTRPTLFRAFRHATRVNPEQEAGAVAMLGYDDVGTVCGQMDFYAAQRPLDGITPLTTATVLLREHQRPEVRRFGVLWWESILAFSKRDQLSFDFARQESGAEIEYFDGFTHDNPLLRWQGSLSAQRVRASFDDRRYAWLHRDDAQAVADPRGHFLRHHSGADTAYQKAPALLEYACQRQRSSLGRQVSPRRGVAEALEVLLAPHRQAGQRWLLVRVQGSPSPRAFSEAEHQAAAQALSMTMAPAAGTLIDVQAAELQAEGNVVYVGQAQFDAVVVLGAGAQRLPALLFKLQRLLAPAAGTLVAVLDGPATLEEAALAEAWFARQLGAGAQAQLQAARHDSDRDPLPNSLLALTWRTRAGAQAGAAAA